MTSTGISAADRAATVLAAIDPKTRPADLARPGHMFPLKAVNGGVLVRAGQTEAAVDLARIAGLYPAGVICEILNKDGTMARVPELTKFARRHKLPMITIADLINYRVKTEALVRRVASAALPTDHGEFRVIAFESILDKETHVALVKGRDRRRRERHRPRPFPLSDRRRLPLLALRLRPAARRGDDAHRRGRARRAALSEPGRARHRSREQDPRLRTSGAGTRTVEANERLGFKPDQRDYGIGVQILKDLGVKSMRLLSNNPRKLVGLEGYGLSVAEWLPLEIPASATTMRYLKTKKDKLGHRLKGV